MKNYDISLPKVFRKYYTKKKDISKNIKQYDQYKLAKLYLFSKMSGGNPEKVEIKFEGKKYEFIYEKDENIYSIFDKNNDSRCIMISFDPETKTASINNINGDYEGCPNGSKLLDASINFLKKNKKIFDIYKIELEDKSIKTCGNVRIKFSAMYMLTHGITWYNSRGFFPYDTESCLIDKFAFDNMYNNKYIIENSSMSTIVNIKKYIEKYGGKNSKKINKKIDSISHKSVKYLFNLLLSKFDSELCYLYSKIYEQIMKDLGIKSLHGQSYVLLLY